MVGAGPFGLSIAAHLRGRKVNYRILGKPMESWQSKMPTGMLLKSAGFASNLSDPEGAFTLKRFCGDRGLKYQDVDHPIPVEQFVEYGLDFQQRVVPDLECEEVTSVDLHPNGFELRTSGGDLFRAGRVVLAMGLNYFRHIPEVLAALPKGMVSHAADHHDLEKFRGQRVAVIGSGASAIDTAVLLHEAQASVHLISRKPDLVFSGLWGGSGRHSILKPMLLPISGIGPGWMHRFYADLPWLFRYFPEAYRMRTGEGFPSPSAGLPMKDRSIGLPKLLGHSLEAARAGDTGVQLRLRASAGSARTVDVDHVIAGTGYKADVLRLPFLSPALVQRLRLVGKAPWLSPNFETSVPGLYFAGPVTATMFGPVMRFVFGADFTAHRISSHLAHQTSTEAASRMWYGVALAKGAK
ncbi:NAD(P)-binding domain-containing protein [Methylobacterium nodulans]|uniref:NAD(P)-binding domain-containing protein n=1 Tax=Methylobacterium nodulans TaxID=114616 RepID=UPI0018DB4C2B|nr:NAD(P)-binding domain-containing protein [Methylobacterium nodulans]